LPALRALRHTRTGIVLLIAALCVRALVPEGFMPARGHLVELCTEHGLQRMLVDPATGEVLGQEEDTASPTCPWSLMLPTLAPPAPPAAAMALFPGRETPSRSNLPVLVPDRPALPPVRAPPRPI
jgi:hypothetical protein